MAHRTSPTGSSHETQASLEKDGWVHHLLVRAGSARTLAGALAATEVGRRVSTKLAGQEERLVNAPPGCRLRLLDLVDLAIHEFVEGAPEAREVGDPFRWFVVEGEVAAYAADLALEVLGVDGVVESVLDVVE